jgi:hypothetical protein
VRTDFNQNARGFMAAMINFSAKLFAVTPAKGAETPIWACSAPELAKETGKIFKDEKELVSKFREPEAIAELEKICARMTDAKSAAA